MTLDDHLLSEAKEILETTELKVATSRVSNDINPPLAHLFLIGETPASDNGEATTRNVNTEMLLTVFINGNGSEDALNEERNRRKEEIEYALQTHSISAYDGTRYSADSFIISIRDSSGVFDDVSGHAAFIMRFSINYYKKVK